MTRSSATRFGIVPVAATYTETANTDGIEFSTFNYNPSGQDFTLCMSVYFRRSPVGGANDYNLYAQKDGTGSGRSWLFWDRTNGTMSTFFGGSGTLFSKQITTNQWYRFALVKSGTSLSLYINGVLDSTVTPPSYESATGVHVIGNNKGYVIGGMFGHLSTAIFYNRALSSTEVATDYYSGPSKGTGCQYVLRLDEGSGTSCSDTSGNGYNATITGGTWQTAQLPYAVRTARTSATSLIAARLPEILSSYGVTAYYDWRDGYANQGKTSVDDQGPLGHSLSYRGTTAIGSVYTTGEYSVNLENSTTDYFKQNQPCRINSGSTFGSLTAFSWFKKESNVVGMFIARWRPTGTGRSWQLRITGGSLLSFFASANGTTTAVNINSASAYTDTNWNMFTVVNQQSSNTLKMYVNGQSISYNFVSGSAAATIFDSEIETWVGALPDASNNPTVPFDGKIGICGFCKGTALSDAQVLDLYNLTGKLGGYI